jgi:hypothetical protein
MAASAQTQADYMKILLAGILFVWNLTVASHLETPYPPALIELYALPLTRILLILLVLLAASWCPTVGILMAFAYVCLGADVIFFTYNSELLHKPHE